MEITVKLDKYRGHYTYRPICENAKILAVVAGSKNLSIDMIERAHKYGVKINDISNNKLEEKQVNQK